MTNAISKTQLDTSLQKVKTYIDNQANANVYQEETQLWLGNLYVSGGLNTNTTTTTVDGRTWTTMWGQTTGAIATLSDDVANYDILRFYGSTHDPGVGLPFTFDVVVNNNIRFETVPNLHPVTYYEFYDSTSVGSGAKQVFSAFGIGQTADNKIGIQLGAQNVEDSGVWMITGIKYVPQENYSTTEQIVGKWVDGSNVYMRTFTGNMPAITRGNSGQISTTNVKPKILIDAGGSMTTHNSQGTSCTRMLGQPVVFPTDGTVQNAWNSSAIINAAGELAFWANAPDTAGADYTTTSDTYNFWVKYTK